MLLSFGMAFDAYMKTGLMNFGPKTLEVRFHVSAAEAAAKGGVITVPGAILGAIYGGVHVRLFNLNGRGIITFTTVVQVITAIFFGLSCFITCQGFLSLSYRLQIIDF